MILQPRKTFCCQFNFEMTLFWCLSSYSGSGREKKFRARWGVLTMVLLFKVSRKMLLTTNITFSILILGWQQTMSRQCGTRLNQKSKSMFGPINWNMIPDYLAEFMWNQRFNEHSHFHFWTKVTQQYPFWTPQQKYGFFKIHRSK